MDITTKTVRRGAMAVAAVAVMGALGACSIGTAGNGTAGNSAAGNGASTPQSSGANAAQQGAGGSTAQNGWTRQGATATGAANTGSHPSCTALKVSQSSPDLVKGSNSQWKLPITFTNQGSVPCTVQGFPGVRLDGEDGTSWDLVRTNETAAPVLLGPGEHVTADLTYLTATGGSGWHVAHVAVTPPNGTNTQTMPWADSLDLVKQDAATHPGTYIGPVHAG